LIELDLVRLVRSLDLGVEPGGARPDVHVLDAEGFNMPLRFSLGDITRWLSARREG